jgi:hypothetical protein
MLSWSEFAEAAPKLASFGKHRLEGRIAYFATIRSNGSPRLHPVSPFIANNDLFIYMEPTSPKGHDLRRDSRYAMHCAVEDSSGGQGELLISGKAIEVSNEETRKDAFDQASLIGYNPQERYILFELKIEEATATVYEGTEIKRDKWKAV